MISKPLIGLNSDYRSAKKDQPSFSYLYSGYYDAILEAGGLPVILPPLASAADVEQLVSRLDGLVLVGGADLDPTRDGFLMHSSIRRMEARREDFDRLLVDQAAKKKIPTLGVGAGMQLLNVSQGGNLMFDIQEDIPKSIPHRDSLDRGHRHALEVIPGTAMRRIYGDSEVCVNSQHHMAVDEVAFGFIVSARAPDGVIEAIESIRKDWFALGVQFHPESASASALDKRIFEEFVGVCAGTEEIVSPRLLQMVG